MPSPEQIGIFYAPVDRMGGFSSGLPGPEEPQQNLSIENPLPHDQNLPQSSPNGFALTEENLQDTGAEQPDVSLQMEQVVTPTIELGITVIGLTGSEHPQQSFLAEESVPQAAQYFPLAVESPLGCIQASLEPQLETGDSVPVTSQAFASAEKAENPNQQVNRPQDARNTAEREEIRNTKEKLFIWGEDLSKNGRKLYWLLLGDIGYPEYLPELAQNEEIELEAGLQELRGHGVLDESNPTIIRIKF